MATYLYRCTACEAEQTVNHPMGTAPATASCVVCGEEAKRKFTPPTTVIR